MADWTDFLKAPTKAAKQLHVSKGDIAKGEALNAYDRLAERMKTGEPYGQTLKDPVEEIENPYPRIRAQLRDKMISDARRKYGEAAPKVTGSLSSSLDVLRHAFMRDEEAKDIARGLAMTAGLAGGVAAPMMVPSAPALTGAVINAATGIPINLALNSPEGIPQDAVAGGVMGALAGAGHPGLGALAGLASYAATNVPEASAMPLHSWMKYLKNNRGDIGHTPLYVDPTRAELTDARKRSMGSSIESNSVPVVRMMRDLTTPNTTYAWDGNSLLHRDVADHLKLLQTQTRGAISLPEEDPMSWIDWLKQLPQEKAGGGAVKRLGKAAMSQFDELRGSSVAPLGALSVVKPKGGNWLTGSVEDALRGLRPSATLYPRGQLDSAENILRQAASGEIAGIEDLAAAGRNLADFQRQRAISSWIEGPLTKYVKTRMASPDDEVRRLAEQGVLHFEPQGIRERSPLMEKIVARREGAGFPLQGLADSPLADQWEKYSDAAIANHTALDLSAAERDATFGGKKVPKETVVHAPIYNQFGPHAVENLGFNHLIDELSNALNPNSGLPRNLQLTPEAVKNMSMEKAVRLVADINAHRAAQQVEANKKLAEQAMLVREYAENNPKGLRWVELKASDPDPAMYKLREAKFADGSPHYEYVDSSGEPVASAGRTPEEAAQNLKATKGEAELQRQLKYEGETMGHCVGGYCDDVLSGRSRIFSLRDAKGEPHVTVEVAPKQDSRRQEFIARNAGEIDRILRGQGEEAANAYIAEHAGSDIPSIVQIKGKQNRAPNPEYLPFVQDFVRNSPLGGQWGDVGDLHNTGLRRTRDIWNDLELTKIREAGHEVGDFTSAEDKERIGKAVWGDLWGNHAHGGSVHQSVQNNDFQAMIAALEQELAHATS